jgi:hypothetical protein
MISFTQFLFPDGRKKIITIDRPQEIQDKYDDLASQGFRFEIENNRGEIWATCQRSEDETVDVIGVNDATVPVLIDKLISNAWEIYIWKEIK